MGVGLLPSFCPPPSLLLLLLSPFFHALFSKHKKPTLCFVAGVFCKTSHKDLVRPRGPAHHFRVKTGPEPPSVHPGISALELSTSISALMKPLRRCLQPGDMGSNLKMLPHFASHPHLPAPPQKASTTTSNCLL